MGTSDGTSAAPPDVLLFPYLRHITLSRCRHTATSILTSGFFGWRPAFRPCTCNLSADLLHPPTRCSPR
ncbi:hypothetical protein HPB50_000116 [Hyalomma asiaticum]|uniref:Uncharacterized protein n=1 Tax=Hyalomma asiaticum TaxID=266040 RepID=A0ACB7TEL0_HYAAI|nr:hypothetical protein HPB50_000116 [Hyalomma asiaticum]